MEASVIVALLMKAYLVLRFRRGACVEELPIAAILLSPQNSIKMAPHAHGHSAAGGWHRDASSIS